MSADVCQNYPKYRVGKIIPISTPGRIQDDSSKVDAVILICMVEYTGFKVFDSRALAL
jgi:hypothetical protein